MSPSRSVPSPRDQQTLPIGGTWATPSGRERIHVFDPATGDAVGSVPHADAVDVDRAVAAAHAARPAWSSTPVERRVAVLRAVADEIEARRDELAALQTREVGTPLTTSRRVHVDVPALVFRETANALEAEVFEEQVGSSLVVRDPVGVVAAITPWNYPFYQIAAKVAPALAAGCTVVLKPSELAPLSAFVLAEIFDELDVPDGTYNVVTGDGPGTGEALAGHPDVAAVSFTGSGRAGRRVVELGAATVKRVTLELGGKSANVLLDDVDLSLAVPYGVNKCFSNAGQTCTAPTRMLVPVDRLPAVEDLAATAVEAMSVGDPFDEKTTLGPLVSDAQAKAVRGFIDRAVAEGARVVVGGSGSVYDHDRSTYVLPTVLSDVTPDMDIARQEVFGPVLCLMTYEDEDDAVAIANDTDYGLSGSVWSSDEDRAVAVARRLDTGQVSINGRSQDPGAPFGGYKQSGVGRELGRYGIDEFLELKAIAIGAVK